MSNERKKRSKYTKTSTNGPSWNFRPRVSPPSPVARWYTGPSEIPLCRFFKAALTADLRQLVIAGNPSEETLLAAWGLIWTHFLDGMQTENSRYAVRLKSEVDKLNYDYRMIQLAIQRLSLAPDIAEVLGKELSIDWALQQLRRRVRVVGQFDLKNAEQYYQDLIVVLNQALSLRHRQQEKQAELDRLRQQMGATGEITEQQFDDMVSRLSLFAKFQIDRRKTTLSEFMSLWSSMMRHEEHLKKEVLKTQARR